MRRAFLLVALSLVASPAARAERLPIKTYTIVDGLPSDYISRIVRDRQGFLWIGTADGLSRFDTHEFKTIDLGGSLTDGAIRDILISGDGSTWVGTSRGLAHLPSMPRGLRAWEVVPLRTSAGEAEIIRLFEESPGKLWVGTVAGLMRLERKAGAWQATAVDLPAVPGHQNDLQVNDLVADGRGRIWIGTRWGGLYRRLQDGATTHVEMGLPARATHVTSLLVDRMGKLWMGTNAGLLELDITPSDASPRVEQWYSVEDGLPGNIIRALLESSDGTFYVATESGLAILGPSVAPRKRSVHSYAQSQGLSADWLSCLGEDPGGNVWIGTGSRGAMKLIRDGFTTDGTGDGLEGNYVRGIFEDRSGNLEVVTSSLSRQTSMMSGVLHLNRLEQDRFQAVRVDLAGRRLHWPWELYPIQDREGDWWIPTAGGLLRIQGTDRPRHPSSMRPDRVYTTRDGLPLDAIRTLYEDVRGDIWIGAGGLARWERRTGLIRNFTREGLFPASDATGMAEAPDGSLWITYWGGLARFREGQMTHLTPEQGLPSGELAGLHQDGAGRLWLPTDDAGVIEIQDPSEARLRYTIYSTAQGLGSNSIECVTEDRWGRMYFCTRKGVDRLDLTTGRVRHYTTDDGLAQNDMHPAFRDRRGDLWFGGFSGLSRLVPSLDPPAPPPSIQIQSVRVAGEARDLSPLGESNITGLILTPDQKTLEVEYVGLSYSPGERLQYQYKLEGVDHDWGPPSGHRATVYTHLTPGHYRFLVRAVTSDGLESLHPASIRLRVLAPLWMHWWFFSGAAGALLGAAGISYRRRVGRLLELERVRTRIATDLHDDLGSSLSRIAILSEVAGRQVDGADSPVRERLATIAGASRELVDSMSDIVWAINPKRDRLEDLVQRMRRFADDLFSARDVALEFNAPAGGHGLKLGADVRREVYLVLKESVNNAVRHSGCNRARVDLQLGKNRLKLQVWDNGRGFDRSRSGDGHGLDSMKARARRLGGDLTVTTSPEGGTRVDLDVPLRPRQESSRRRSPT